MDLFIGILLLIILIYGFNAIKTRASRQTKRVGLVVWFGLGLFITGYSVFAAGDGGIGIVILGLMAAFFWVVPTGALLYLDIKNSNQKE